MWCIRGALGPTDAPCSKEDVTLVTNVLTALKALDLCKAYVVTTAPLDGRVVVRGTLRDDVVEVDSDDMHLLLGVSPTRYLQPSLAHPLAPLWRLFSPPLQRLSGSPPPWAT